MKLLLDNNLSWRSLRHLDASFEGSTSVQLLDMESTPDRAIWIYAAKHGFVVATKDDDFRAMSLAKGHPPKVIFLTTGDVPAAVTANVLNAAIEEISRFGRADGESLLYLP